MALINIEIILVMQPSIIQRHHGAIENSINSGGVGGVEMAQNKGENQNKTVMA